MKNAIAVACFTFAACQSGPPVSAAEPTTTRVSPPSARRSEGTRAATQQDVRAPLIVTWVEGGTVSSGVTAPGPAVTRLLVHVDQPGVVEVPARFSVRFPPGVEVVRGQLVQTLAVAPAGTTRDLAFEVRYLIPPTAPAIATVDAQGPSSGVHAEVPYYFGRPAPASSPPPMTAPIVVNGLNLGPAVDMQAVERR